MSREHPRPRGNLLPRPVPPDPPGPCIRYKFDVEEYERTGRIVPVSEPEIYEMPKEVELDNPFKVTLRKSGFDIPEGPRRNMQAWNRDYLPFIDKPTPDELERTLAEEEEKDRTKGLY